MGKTVYQLDAAGYFVGEAIADESPRRPGTFHIPGGCVELAPPVDKPGTRRRLVHGEWTYEPIPGYGEQPPVPAEPTLDDHKRAKRNEISAWKMHADAFAFEYLGKLIECDAASRSSIDGIAGYVSLFGQLPPDFPGVWKTLDNAYLPIATADDFRTMYAAMVAAGTANFARSEGLKALADAAESVEALAAITWRTSL